MVLMSLIIVDGYYNQTKHEQRKEYYKKGY